MIDLDNATFGTVLLSPSGGHFALDDGGDDEFGLFAWLRPLNPDGRPAGKRRRRLYYAEADGWTIPGQEETTATASGTASVNTGAAAARAGLAVPTLGDSIADSLQALAELVRVSPQLAEQIRYSLRQLPVRMLGYNPPEAIVDICAQAEALGATTTPLNRGHGTQADIRLGRHLVLWLYTNHDSYPGGN